MKRLTRKVQLCRHLITGREIKYNSIEDDSECIDKLGELEDIEEKLGIDLKTYVKSTKIEENQVVYIKYKKPEEDQYIIEEQYIADRYYGYYLCKFSFEFAGQFTCYIKDYGKTWALTREELE